MHYAGAHREVGVGALDFELSHSPAIHTSADGRRVEQAGAGPGPGPGAGAGGRDASEGGGGGGGGGSNGGSEGVTRLQSLRVCLDLRFVDERFGSAYGRTGSASLGHALQAQAFAQMDPAAYADFQRQQMGLRGNMEMERPLGPAAAATQPFVPNFAVLPAPIPAAGARGTRASAAAAASSSTTAAAPRRATGGVGRSSAAAAARPQWQDTVEKKDEDEGFKF